MSPPPVGRRRAFAAFLVASALLGGLVVCTRPPGPRLVRVGTHVWPGYAPLYLARWKGAFDGTDVRLVEVPTSSESMRGLRSGALEAACLTLDEALRVQATGSDLRILAVLDYSAGGDALLARGDIATLADLRGRRVGAEEEGVGRIFLARALASVGMRLSDVVPVDLEAQEHEPSLLSGKVDAVVTFEPRVGRLLREGAHRLADSAQVAGDVIDLLVVKSDMLRVHPRAVQVMLAAWQAACAEMLAGAATRETAATMGLTEADLVEGLREIRVPSVEESRSLVARASPALTTSARALSGELVTMGIAAAALDPERLFLTAPEREVLGW